MKIQAICAAVVVAFTVLLSGSSAWALFGSDKFEQEAEKEADAVKLARETMNGGYDLITTEELKAKIDAGEDFLLIDAMPMSAFEKEHIPGAVQFLFPIPEMSKWDAEETDGKSTADFEALLGPDKHRPVIVYCGFVKCTRSHNGAMWAKKLGYHHVLRHPGGIFAWKGLDYPVESGN